MGTAGRRGWPRRGAAAGSMGAAVKFPLPDQWPHLWQPPRSVETSLLSRAQGRKRAEYDPRGPSGRAARSFVRALVYRPSAALLPDRWARWCLMDAVVVEVPARSQRCEILTAGALGLASCLDRQAVAAAQVARRGVRRSSSRRKTDGSRHCEVVQRGQGLRFHRPRRWHRRRLRALLRYPVFRLPQPEENQRVEFTTTRGPRARRPSRSSRSDRWLPGAGSHPLVRDAGLRPRGGAQPGVRLPGPGSMARYDVG